MRTVEVTKTPDPTDVAGLQRLVQDLTAERDAARNERDGLNTQRSNAPDAMGDRLARLDPASDEARALAWAASLVALET